MSDVIQYSRKVVLLGDPAVGKTSIVRKFVYDLFDDKYMTTLGTKVSKKPINYYKIFNDPFIELTMMIWDVMGQKDYRIFHDAAFSGARGALIVSDITRKETVDNWLQWKDDLYQVAGTIPVVMIGNKNDMAEQHPIEISMLENLAASLNVPFYLTSAKTGENVEIVFYTLGENVLKNDYYH